MPTQTLKAEVCRIVAYNYVEVQIDLGFGVSVRRHVRLTSAPQLYDEAEAHAARHCAAVLMGKQKGVSVTCDTDALAATIDADINISLLVHPDDLASASPVLHDPPIVVSVVDALWAIKRHRNFNVSDAYMLSRGKPTKNAV